MESDRPDWDEYFLGVAFAVSARGDCRRSRVGAVLVDDRSKRILSTGYNGVEPGAVGCIHGGCPRGLRTFDEVPAYSSYENCVSKHAEHNCLDFWRDYSNYQDAKVTMYITRAPCHDCQELMRVDYVGKAVWPNGYLDLTPWKGM